MVYTIKMENSIYDTTILGGGPSGLTAAIYTARAHLNTLVLAGNPTGGQLMWTTEVENYPGFVDGVLGPELVSNMRKQAERFGAVFQDKNAKKISGSFENGFTIETEDGASFKTKTIIVATGASAKWLDLESEQKLRGKGVSACATCDGFFFKDQVVVVVGGGDAAMEEANYLTKFASKVYVLVRGDKKVMRASKIMQERSFKNPKIEFLYNTHVKQVLGDSAMTGLLVENCLTNETKNIRRSRFICCNWTQA